MSWHTRSSTGRRETDTQRENIETAIRLYETSKNPQEEERWLRILEGAFRSLFIFTERDFSDVVRAQNKRYRDELLSRFGEIIRRRRNGGISKFELARDMRCLCILQALDNTQSRQHG
jgi:hypothetical protein